MTDQEAVAKLNKNEQDAEAAHILADKILLDVLREYGHNDVAEAYEATRRRIGFWYS